jgi:hypothetical protein
MEFLENIPNGVLAAIAASALGGYVGGLLVGVRANLALSAFVGVIIGLSVSTIVNLLSVEPIFGVEGYSLV